MGSRVRYGQRYIKVLQCKVALQEETKMTESVSLTVIGMKCGGCEANVTGKLQAIEGVLSVSASSKDKEVNVSFDADKISLADITDAIVEAGFSVEAS